MIRIFNYSTAGVLPLLILVPMLSFLSAQEMSKPSKDPQTLAGTVQSPVPAGRAKAGVEGVDMLPPEHRIAWNPGIKGGIPHYPVGVNVKEYGAVGDGVADDTGAFLASVAAAPAGTAILIPAGTYKLTSTIRVGKGVALRGEGYEQTRLIGAHSDDLVNFAGKSFYDITRWIELIDGFTKDSNQVLVADGSGFRPGDYVEIAQDMDPVHYITGQGTGWLEDKNLHGQVMQIASVSGNRLTFVTPLHFSYNGAIGPKIAKRILLDGAGIEYLTLYRDRPYGDSAKRNIRMSSAANCWVRNVWSEKGGRANISITHSYRCEVRGSVVYDATRSGDGGWGYGVSLTDHASDCLIEDNIFMRLRSAMIIQLGATGCVFGYNYARDTFKDSYDVMYPGYEISCHGHYPTMCLFEGNTVQRGKIGNYWGRNGPMTFLRNRFEKHPDSYPSAIAGNSYGALTPPYRRSFLEVWENNPYHNIIGNEIGVAGSWECSPNRPPLYIDDDSSPHCRIHGNHIWQEDSIAWDPSISNKTIPASFYLKAKPSFFGKTPFPCIGGDMHSRYQIPAQQRFDRGAYIGAPGPRPPRPPQGGTPVRTVVTPLLLLL